MDQGCQCDNQPYVQTAIQNSPFKPWTHSSLLKEKYVLTYAFIMYF